MSSTAIVVRREVHEQRLEWGAKSLVRSLAGNAAMLTQKALELTAASEELLTRSEFFESIAMLPPAMLFRVVLQPSTFRWRA